MKLPQKLSLDQTTTTWATAIEPTINNPIANASILKSVSLKTGTNQVNHLLGQKLQGWWLIRQRSAGTVYDQQDSNQTPALTLTLIASANMVVDIAVI